MLDEERLVLTMWAVDVILGLDPVAAGPVLHADPLLLSAGHVKVLQATSRDGGLKVNKVLALVINFECQFLCFQRCVQFVNVKNFCFKFVTTSANNCESCAA